jgi:hypothetical protein
MSSLTDEDVSEVAGELMGHFFRAGIWLGFLPHELDRLEIDAMRQGGSAWQVNMQLLQRWRERTDTECERAELARVLKRLGKGRLAVRVDASVKEWKVQSVLDTSRESLSARELEEVSREGRVCEVRRQLAVHLRVDEAHVRNIESASEEESVKAFRCLWAWREAEEDASKASLADALRKVELGRLASKIWKPP